MNPLAAWGLAAFLMGWVIVSIIILIGPQGTERAFAIKNTIFYTGVGAYLLGLGMILVGSTIEVAS